MKRVNLVYKVSNLGLISRLIGWFCVVLVRGIGLILHSVVGEEGDYVTKEPNLIES